MHRVFLSLCLLIILTPCRSQPLPGQSRQNIIIDTDCGIDDMRAISILLAAPDIIIHCILISDGSLPPNQGYIKIRQLLHTFGRDSVILGVGPVIETINPPWREFNQHIEWGEDSPSIAPMVDANKVFSEIVRPEDTQFTYVCLGPLTNLARVIQSDSGAGKIIDRVIWYNEPDSPMKGFNYNCDKTAANDVLNRKMKVILISGLQKPGSLFDTVLYKTSMVSKTRLAGCFAGVHSQPEVLNRLKQEHFKLADELVALYLLNPELFDINTVPGKVWQRYDADYNVQGVREAIGDMIRGTYSRNQNVVFMKFPDSRESFQYDVRQIMDSAISRHGYDEWKANVLTDEFHGHLGVFSIVGAKMGIKAREIFGVGPDELKALSYAGLKPPYSCINDGIQVSTGATLGMGTIQVVSDSIAAPVAVFTYRNRSVRISLKEEYLRKINENINEGIVKFGLMDDGYWKLVRRNALRYWVDWDRNQIFTIQEI